ncbi:MAG: hypothetical protein JSS22_09735 [Proteobacteria bacterium]|nr:hypothetical protein [Pseudomonadota bacterium]
MLNDHNLVVVVMVTPTLMMTPAVMAVMVAHAHVIMAGPDHYALRTRDGGSGDGDADERSNNVNKLLH